jgi:Fe2+-dicitrate sensor, membrane component
MPKQTRYTNFLKDKQFIRWQLAPDESLNAYWLDFVKENPQLEKELQQAIAFLKTEGLNKNVLSNADRKQLLHSIQVSIRHDKKAKDRRIFRFAIAACAAIALVVVGITLFTREKTVLVDPDKELIVGELLNSEDIQLITSEEAASFQHDVEVTIGNDGTAKITQSNIEGEKTVEITKDRLNSLIVPYGKRSTLTLADGSKVWLNSGSVLEFPAQFTAKNREIHLASGEMYIEVTHDKKRPFYVHTSDFQVKVYGTAFNLSAYENASPSVVLVEGSVALRTSANKEETPLRPNELAVYDSQSGTFNKQKVDIQNHISWKEGYLTLQKTPMTEILDRIGRYYNLSFNYEQDVNLQKRTCTGKIYLSENLDNVMTTIALLSSTRYEKENNRIYITNELN